MADPRGRMEGHANGGSELKLQLLCEKMVKLSRKELSKWWEIESLQRCIDVEIVPRGLRIYTIPTYEDPDPDMLEWAENSKVRSFNMMKILIKYAAKDRKKILDEIDKVSTEILSLTSDDGVEEFKKNLEKKLNSLEEDIMSKKQHKFICDFKDYQSGRILTPHRKYDHLYVENEKEPLVENNRDFTSEVEESDISDGSQSDVSDSLLEKGAAADKNLSRIVTPHRKYDHLYVENEKEPLVENNRDFTSESGRKEGQTKENKYFPKEVGVEVQEAEEEESGSKDMSKEKKSPGKQA
ncbi:hypothetical protein NDU88_010724 [Pleurodeles waltl]|uniref:Uncharacterized protein n=1 Tax=Pleurodeles waltl TaxID=8319 RepID=A0AAV7R1D4_PLEWA|nr:hypothetical protein NDU88_010724 [Pleurodeles waltl]